MRKYAVCVEIKQTLLQLRYYMQNKTTTPEKVTIYMHNFIKIKQTKGTLRIKYPINPIQDCSLNEPIQTFIY